MTHIIVTVGYVRGEKGEEEGEGDEGGGERGWGGEVAINLLNCGHSSRGEWEPGEGGRREERVE